MEEGTKPIDTELVRDLEKFGIPAFGHSGLENVSAWIALGWFILEIVTAALNPRRRAFHDLIAGTVVVRA